MIYFKKFGFLLLEFLLFIVFCPVILVVGYFYMGVRLAIRFSDAFTEKIADFENYLED